MSEWSVGKDALPLAFTTLSACWFNLLIVCMSILLPHIHLLVTRHGARERETYLVTFQFSTSTCQTTCSCSLVRHLIIDGQQPSTLTMVVVVCREGNARAGEATCGLRETRRENTSLWICPRDWCCLFRKYI